MKKKKNELKNCYIDRYQINKLASRTGAKQ